MPTDYSYLFDEYPATISQDQLYRICHISKRKATWLLLNGYIPCKDTGKKTRRFTIQITDVISYLSNLEADPQSFATPIGIFSNDSKSYKKKAVCDLIDPVRFTTKLKKEWQHEPDVFTTKQVSVLLGYSTSTIGTWVSKNHLKAIHYHSRYLIPKECLIEYLATVANYNINIYQKSSKHLALIDEC